LNKIWYYISWFPREWYKIYREVEDPPKPICLSAEEFTNNVFSRGHHSDGVRESLQDVLRLKFLRKLKKGKQ